MAELSYDLFKEHHALKYTPISFFFLQDGESAYVRFHLESVKELPTYQVHRATIGGKHKAVKCTGESCALCKCGDKPQSKLYLELIVYDIDPAANKIVIKPCIWERSAFEYGNRLLALEEEYGNLEDYVFKITRNGQVGDSNTTYEIFPANPKHYTDDIYKKDFSAFKNFSVETFLFRTTVDNEEVAKRILQLQRR